MTDDLNEPELDLNAVRRAAGLREIAPEPPANADDLEDELTAEQRRAIRGAAGLPDERNTR